MINKCQMVGLSLMVAGVIAVVASLTALQLYAMRWGETVILQGPELFEITDIWFKIGLGGIMTGIFLLFVRFRDRLAE